MKAVFALGALLLIGCGKDCPDAPCMSYVQINFSSILTEPGSYQFDVVADSEPMKCVLHIPAHTDDECDEALGLVRAEEKGAGGAGGASMDQDGILGIGVIGVYEQVSITVIHAEDELGSDSFEPEYQEEDSCGGCPFAEHELQVVLD